jgi:hypothetical protein
VGSKQRDLISTWATPNLFAGNFPCGATKLQLMLKNYSSVTSQKAKFVNLFKPIKITVFAHGLDFSQAIYM